MSQIKRKIQGLKTKIKNFDLDYVETNEEKFEKEDINYLKEKKILLRAEIDLITQKFEKMLASKKKEQIELEQKLMKKSQKQQKILEEIENHILKIKETKIELLKMTNQLSKDEKDESKKK